MFWIGTFLSLFNLSMNPEKILHPTDLINWSNYLLLSLKRSNNSFQSHLMPYAQHFTHLHKNYTCSGKYLFFCGRGNFKFSTKFWWIKMLYLDLAFLYNLDDLTSEILGSYVRFQKWSKMSDHYEKQEISLIEIGKKATPFKSNFVTKIQLKN